MEWVAWVVRVSPVELVAWVVLVSPVESAAWVVLASGGGVGGAAVRRNYLLAEPEATGSIIRRIVVAHPMETAQRPIDSAAQLAATPSPTGRPAQETRSDAREEIFRAIAAAPAPATA